MGLLFVYILKSSVCLAVFYLFYRLLLSRETFHRFNRFALLGILVLSCLIPFIEVNVMQQTEVRHTIMTLEQWLLLADALNSTNVEVQTQEVTVTWMQVTLMLYLAGILFFAFRNIYSLVRMVRLLKSGSREDIANFLPGGKRVALIVHNRDITPFSWMKYIVISQKDLDENGREILIHEMAHITNRHSLDLFITEVCVFFQWFNPASWLLKQELQNIHEFEADETVIKEGVDAKQYQLLLIKKAVGTRLYSMANSFNHSKLKKRITMMLKEKSNPWARLKYFYVLPIAAIAVTAFARPEVSETTKEISSVKVNDLTAIVEAKVAESLVIPTANVLRGDTTKPADVKYVPVEVTTPQQDIDVVSKVQMPEFPDGGMQALMQYLQQNMRYPESAKKAGKQGRVIVQFVVEKDGSISSPVIVRSVDKEIDAEAIRLVKAMPKWKPGKQDGQLESMKFTIPILFNLGAESALAVTAGSETALLYIVDGIEISSAVLKEIDPNKIASISVLKGASAISIYGEKGKNGVMLITLKKQESPFVAGANGIDIKTSNVGNKVALRVQPPLIEFDTEGLVVYLDGVKVDVAGRAFEDIIPSNQIASMSVNKSAEGNGEIHITTKKDKGDEKTLPQDFMKVKGVVKDEQGKPVVGAIVVIEGTNSGSITGADGQFTLITSDKDAVLTVSYVNMVTAKVKVTSNMSVTLKSE